MTHKEIVLEDMVEIINKNGGIEVFSQLMSNLLNFAMVTERSDVLGALPYERTEQRRGYANGFKPKTLRTRIGNVPVQVPQVRGEVDFYPSALTKGPQTERALMLAVAEMYVNGVSTRKVEPIMQKLVGHQISSTTVSKASAMLDETLEAWRNRPLNNQPVPYLILDARYEKVRINGIVRDAAVLIAIGIGADGKRSVLGVSTSLSEAEIHWREFLISLTERGLHGVEMITSDDHKGLNAARKAVFSSVPWQRCQFHLQQNATAYVPKKSMLPEVAEDIRDIFNAPKREAAEQRLKDAVNKYADIAPQLSAWMEANLPEGLTVFLIDSSKHRKRLRTSNLLENLNGKINKRTSVVGLFPSIESLLRLVSAVLMETDERWQTGKRYLATDE